MASARVLIGLKAVRRPPTRAVVTVGVFDGVHRAHQQLVQSTVRMARRLGGTSVVITFDPDPQAVLDPAHAAPALMPVDVRVRHLGALGVDWVWIIRFTKRFARLSAEQFVRRILLARLCCVALIVGETFVFGKDRAGDMTVLRALGPPRGMQIIPVWQIRREGEPISSSRIRALIAHGQLARARALLGRSPTVYGVVIRGSGRGRRLGLPTANIRFTSQVLPTQGVYAVVVERLTDGRKWRGAMNLGVRPTFGPGPLVCETHLLGFSGTLLGAAVGISLLARLRGERCFASPQALLRQVRRDLSRVRRLFARHSS